MNRTTCITQAKRLALGLAVLAIAATPSFAQIEIDLCATTGSITMPDSRVVPIWGYVDITGGGDCATAVATLPNPVIRVTAGDTLIINLTNNLTEPVSLFVPGLPNPAPTGTAHFTTEVAGGLTGSYTFTNVRPGTFLYHSATEKIRTQMPMGLYGALVVDSAPGEAYPGDSYEQDEVLVYSAIDPAINDDPAGSTGARVAKSDDGYAEGPNPDESGWNPKYFLINGKAYPDTEGLAVTPGDDALLRFVNAGLDSVMPTFDGGLYMSLIAEDGNRYPATYQQYGLELTAGKTMDAMVTVNDDGSYALYDRALNLTNAGAVDGGLLVYLSGTAGTDFFRLGAASYSVDETAGGTFVTITVERVGDGVGAVSVDYSTADGTATAGSDYTAIPTTTLDFADGDMVSKTFDITILDDVDDEGDETFSVSLGNPLGGAILGAPASAVVTIADDDSPGALQFNAASYIAAENGGTLTITVDRVGGSAGAVSVDYSTADGTATAPSDYTAIPAATLNFANTVTSATFGVEILPDAVPDGGETFSVNLSNATNGATIGVPATTTVTIVEPANIPPVANDDDYEMVLNTVLSVVGPGLLANDTDADGGPTPLVAANIDPPAFGVAGLASNGAFNYTPNVGFLGADSFTYRAYDGEDFSAAATVTITVVMPPVQAYFSTLNGGNNNPVQDVAAPYDDADIYTWNTTTFGRVLDASAAGLAGTADIDGLVYVSDTEFYVSFNVDAYVLPGEGGEADAEDIVQYLDGAWSVWFDGSVYGLDNNDGQNIDAFDIDFVEGVIYFSTLVGGAANLIPGVAAPYDDADIYTFDVATSTFGRLYDANVDLGLPGNADIDGLTVVDANTFYLSFNRNQGTTVPGIGAVQDEDIVHYDNGTWTVPFVGVDWGLNLTNGRDLDAIDYVP